MSHSPGFYNSQHAGPNGPQPPQPEEEPLHDVPTFPAEDSPPGTETAKYAGPGEHDSPSEGTDDVDDDDLDPQVPHSPPDSGQRAERRRERES